jgi:hypothetical protein
LGLWRRSGGSDTQLLDIIPWKRLVVKEKSYPSLSGQTHLGARAPVLGGFLCTAAAFLPVYNVRPRDGAFEQDLTFRVVQSFGIESTTQLRDLLRGLITEFPEGKMVAELMSGQTDWP